MIPTNITREHVIKALEAIDARALPPSRKSTKFVLVFSGRRYPPKYVVSLASKYANGEELKPSLFGGGKETNNFLKRLGFDIDEIMSTRTKDELKYSRTKSIETTQKKHNERCPECKDTVEKMLKKIYGAVKTNYKFSIGTNPEKFRDTPPYYEDLRRIFKNLQDYRGNENFVYKDTLPNCDYFIPNPGFIVEFDESQHFTIPRKISLLSYPYRSKSGFSLAQWISTCNKTKAHDPEPVYGDEQRAWYDTSRDFLPELTGNLKPTGPTVRLYSKEMQWCSLDPDNPNDVARFKNIIECRRKDLNGWVATAVLQSNEQYSNEERMKVLSKVVESILEKSSGNGVILFPGGMFSTGESEPKTYYNEVEKAIKGILSKTERNIVVCTGIDGSVDVEGYSHDQIGISISKEGIEAIGRKFHPAPQEKGHVELAEKYSSKEDGKSRIFEWNGIKYYMCVCYDSYGIRHKNLTNPDVDVILNLVHCFYPVGKGPSGTSFFARHGFAGASKQWKCPVFGTAVFFNRSIPERWPTGVYWDQGDKNTPKWKYEDNPLKYSREFKVDISEGKASVKIYDL
jgi:predicted amidohydrolase/copper chaperone CopZ